MKHWGAIENLLIGCCSSTHDGRIDYGEFVAMMKEGDGGFGRTRTMKVRTLDWRKKSIETVELEDFHRKKCKPTALTRSPQALSSLSLPLASKSKPFARSWKYRCQTGDNKYEKFTWTIKNFFRLNIKKLYSETFLVCSYTCLDFLQADSSISKGEQCGVDIEAS
ncbi:hypothetical protein L6164_033993 [Bauhinia variegata]|uniref:Uncharacterized protein n=1 Tax=Bauhinia variegata TaxID=167791 RepID=A0ACB9KTE2_BAUVA|nr:hypothetical protein L6164_033993 [Bauhinia variegata]